MPLKLCLRFKEKNDHRYFFAHHLVMIRVIKNFQTKFDIIFLMADRILGRELIIVNPKKLIHTSFHSKLLMKYQKRSGKNLVFIGNHGKYFSELILR